MSILSKSTLNSYRNSNRSFTKSVDDSLTEFLNESKAGKTTVFLSHKHNERKELDAAISLLKKHGVLIYVDWMDESMPTVTSGVTAKKIKDRITASNKFVLLATEAAINSKWCNWELGFGDAKKYIEHIAILPVREDNTEFTGSEYLQIYPRIEFIKESMHIYATYASFVSEGFHVIYPNGNKIALKDWLNS